MSFRPTRKTSVFIDAIRNPSMCGPLSVDNAYNMYRPVSFRGHVTEANSVRYHVEPENLANMLSYILYNARIQKINIVGRMYEIRAGTMHNMIRQDVNLPQGIEISNYFSYVFPLSNGRRADTSTFRAMQSLTVHAQNSNRWVEVREGLYDALISQFMYPVTITEQDIQEHRFVFELYDVLAAIFNHTRARHMHYTLRDRLCRLENIIPVRTALDAFAYQDYLNTYDILSCISLNFTRFSRPTRILVGNNHEFIAVPNQVFREEYEAHSTLARLGTSEWGEELNHSDAMDASIQAQLEHFLRAERQTMVVHHDDTPSYETIRQRQNVIKVNSDFRVLNLWKNSPNQGIRNRYYAFCLRISQIFTTPLLLFKLPHLNLSPYDTESDDDSDEEESHHRRPLMFQIQAPSVAIFPALAILPRAYLELRRDEAIRCGLVEGP